MSDLEPKPPTRQEEKFPKTMTIPEGWNTEGITGGITEGLPNGIIASNGLQPDENSRPVPRIDDEELLNRRLDPFPKPNTIPNGWDLSKL